MPESPREPTLLEVWGDPIEHSKSPALHRVVYDAVGVDWRFERRRVGVDGFADALRAAAGRVRGLAVTMPLKEVAAATFSALHPIAAQTGVVNTIDVARGNIGYNTDVGGIVLALADLGIAGASRARVVGAGATALSAVQALSMMETRHIEIVSRRVAPAARAIELARSLGVSADWTPFENVETAVDLTISTLPNGVEIATDIAARLAETGGVLFDVAYEPWPSRLATAWASDRAHSGLGMLVHQAVLQDRIFVNGSIDAQLPDEHHLVAEMRRAIVGD